MKDNKEILPFVASHPGGVIKDEIEAREGLTQRKLAEMMNISPSLLNEIIKAKRRVNADIALKLEETLGINAFFWLKFQASYDLNSARLKIKKEVETITG